MAFALASSSAFLRLPGDDSPLETLLSGDAALLDSPPKTAATPALDPKEFLRAKGFGRAPAFAGDAGAAAGIDAGAVLPPGSFEFGLGGLGFGFGLGSGSG